MAKRRPKDQVQLPLFQPESDWVVPRLSDLPTRWSGRVCVDTETRDPDLKALGCGARRPGSFIAGYSFAIEDGPSFYIPLRHEGGDNVEDPNQAIQYLRDQAKNFTGTLVGANIPYDLDFLHEEGVDFHSVEWIRDIQIADPLICELHDSYSLQNIAMRHGLPGKDQRLLEEAAAAYGVDPKAGMWRLPARYVGPYATKDATEPLLILRRQERLIEEDDLWDIFNLESKVTPVLMKMRQRGVLVDFDQLTKIEEWSLAEEKRALNMVERETSYQVGVGNVWNAGAMGEALRRIGIAVPLTSKGHDSVDKDLLSSIDHPVAKALAWARKVNKLRTTFSSSIRRYMINGRIHCTFNQIARENDKGDMRGARYGRLSCEDPNLQQQPSRDEFAKEWRKIYVPEPGSLWASNDFSQQEPRWITHFAAMLKLPKADQALQAYIDDPNLDNHQFMADLTSLPRKSAKLVYLGLCYGEGGAKLCSDLGLPTRWAMATRIENERQVYYFESEQEALDAAMDHENSFVWRAAGAEGQAILDQFDDRAPFIRQLMKRAEKTAKKRGNIRTAGGRLLHFPKTKNGYDWAHKSLNRLIQGTSADQMKRAMVNIDAAGHYLQLQIHDETTASVETEKEAKEIASIMSSSMEALLPFRVDTEVGRSWGDSMGD